MFCCGYRAGSHRNYGYYYNNFIKIDTTSIYSFILKDLHYCSSLFGCSSLLLVILIHMFHQG